VCQISGGHRVQFALLPSKHSPAPQQVPEIFQFLIDTRVKKTQKHKLILYNLRGQILTIKLLVSYLILLCEECMGNTFLTSSSSPPNSMNIIFCSQRKTIVYHYFNIWNIQSPCSHISSNLFTELRQIMGCKKQQCLRDPVPFNRHKASLLEAFHTVPTKGISRSPYNNKFKKD